MPAKSTIFTKNNQNRASHCLSATPPKQSELQGLKCPRCDSANTKFCYYNNYNLKQPRYLCKGCRRYWTKGGALRTVPFGGGRRRKIMKSKNCKYVLGNDQLSCGFELFQGFNMDCQLATSTSTTTSVFSNSSVGQDQLNFTLSSIESLSAINQDLYWKEQQQRLALLFGGQHNNNNTNNTRKEEANNFISYFPLQNNSDNYCSTREGENANLVTEWLFDTCSFEAVDPFEGDNWCNDNGTIEEASSWINEMQGWGEYNQNGLLMS